jgi:hypothetical protein
VLIVYVMWGPDATAVPVSVSGPATRVCVDDGYVRRVVDVPGEPVVVFCWSTSDTMWVLPE